VKVVLDASAAVATVVDNPAGAAVLDLLANASVVIAPQLYVCEVTSSLWKYVVAEQMSVTDAAERLDAVLKLVDRYHPESDLTQEVLREATVRRHPVYDLFYAVLARREGATMVTIDNRLKKVARDMRIPVKP
jgi:predicted nucleic acid-binding protein